MGKNAKSLKELSKVVSGIGLFGVVAFMLALLAFVMLRHDSLDIKYCIISIIAIIQCLLVYAFGRFLDIVGDISRDVRVMAYGEEAYDEDAAEEGTEEAGK